MVETIGSIGGGQLGRMTAQEAIRLGFHMTVIDPVTDCPAAQVGAQQVQAELADTEAMDKVSAICDVLTWEIEHFPADHLVHLQNWGANIEPSPYTLLTIQDKLTQKQVLRQAGIPVAPFSATLDEAAFLGGGPYVVKTRKGGYDGRGNLVVDHLDDPRIGQMFGSRPVYVEQAVNFEKELAVVVARDKQGNIATYPVVETEHEANICHTVIAPAEIDPKVADDANEIARLVMKQLQGAGVFAIEMFAVDRQIMVNEIAPRVHNSGHWTDKGAVTSQFEQHVRAITGMPLGPTAMRAPVAGMVNILGRRDEPLSREGLDNVLALPDTHPHFYGKASRPARKIGHITLLGDTVKDVKERATKARGALSV